MERSHGNEGKEDDPCHWTVLCLPRHNYLLKASGAISLKRDLPDACRSDEVPGSHI